MVQISCGEISYEGVEHRRIVGVSPNLARDFVVISRAEFERILGAKNLYFRKCTRVSRQACTGDGGIEVEER